MRNDTVMGDTGSIRGDRYIQVASAASTVVVRSTPDVASRTLVRSAELHSDRPTTVVVPSHQVSVVVVSPTAEEALDDTVTNGKCVCFMPLWGGIFYARNAIKLT